MTARQVIVFPNPAMAENIERLPEWTSRQPPTLRFAVQLAISIARYLDRLHAGKRAHGAVFARNVLVGEGEGWLTPPATGSSAATPGEDALQFAELFRALLAEVREPGGDWVHAELKEMLAGEGPATMRRVAEGMEALLPRLAAGPPRKFVMLVRAVPPEPEAPPPLQRARLPKLFLLALLLSGAALGVALAFFLILKLG